MLTENSTQQHALAPGHMLTLALTEGSTLLCLGAPVQLSTTPLSALDACTGYSMLLYNGQSWCAPGALWVQVLCVEGRSSIRVQPSVPAAKENRLGLADLRRWLVGQWPRRGSSGELKRGQRAA